MEQSPSLSVSYTGTKLRPIEGMMDKDRIKGSVGNLGGKVKEGAGDLTGDSKLKSDGKVDQAKGKIQNVFGGIKDALKGKS